MSYELSLVLSAGAFGRAVELLKATGLASALDLEVRPLGAGDVSPVSAFSKIERETSTGVERERRKLQAVIDAIEEAGRLTPTEAKKLRRQYERAKLDADALRGDRDWLWKRHAGDDLGWYRKRAKETLRPG